MPDARPALMASVILCSAAEVDYTESLCWYGERSIEAAKEFDSEFDHALNQIASTPEQFLRWSRFHGHGFPYGTLDFSKLIGD